jgi:hypothetical protein
MVSFEKFVKSMPSSLSELKVTPSFCFAFKFPDNPTATKKYQLPAVKKDSKNGAARTFFGPSYFDPTLTLFRRP